MTDEIDRFMDDLAYRRDHSYGVSSAHTVDALLLLHEAIVALRHALTDLRMEMEAKERQNYDGRG